MAQVRAPSAVLSTVSVSVVDWMRAGVFTAVVSWARVSVRTSLGVPLYSAEQSPLEAELLVTLSWEIAVQSASEGVLLWDTFPVVVAVLSVPDSAQATLLSAEPSAVFISVVIGTGVGVLARITFTVVRGESLCSVVLLFWAAFLCLVRSCLVAVLPASPSLA
ncbi:MAG: hypothetical protein KVP17_003726 [Porospora cf. gigantea B]|uniref:uncharacterized protein n=1 Tax=Porospora cf. gigantea B TaxID=2853592 RepID=UPI003571986F|nr:MAG: hypothetical protein KVP17_003726 [Porospora cf. gigantea B]